MEAKELFQVCEELAAAHPTPSAGRRLREVLVLCCSGAGKTTFGNLFSQIDWLCKHYGVSAADKQAIQTARRHTNQRMVVSPDDWLYDVRATALLVSAVFSEAIPGSLLRLLPMRNKQQPKGLSINKRYIRCIVRGFDERLITADTDDGIITIDYATKEQGRNFDYLRKLLREGMQLNLLDCHVGEEHVTPGIIVVEPDFLIDISSLAACFTAYGHNPLFYTLNRLKERPNTQATLLGNFSGTALDAVINNRATTTAAMLRRSFREQAVNFCACQGFDAQKFKGEAELQVSNIRAAVDVLNDALGSGGQGEEFLLEPSFVCERLGLQGRVDLMTADMRLLVEQKSGRNMKIEHHSHDSHGRQREDHYVQLLLYYGILRYNFDKGDLQVDTRLLYSHYAPADGLLFVNYYRTLFREAIMLRNQLVALEFLMAREGFGRILPLLTPDTIYKGVARDGFFHRYVLPEVNALCNHLQALPPLERTYLERMATFVYREQLCQKLGVVEGQGNAVADLWQMPLSEKLETGNIYIGLTITKRERLAADGGYSLITLALPTTTETLDENRASNFRRGDMVYLYAYRGEPDVRASILYKGTLQDVCSDCLVVSLTNGQQNPAVFSVGDDRLWAVEHGGSDVSTTSSLKSLFQFVTADDARRALLLGQCAPRADESLQLSHPYHEHYDDILLRAKQARDYFLLVGPPGTGKTSCALRYLIDEELSSPLSPQSSKVSSFLSNPPSLLLTAYTNRAVDEICGMLTEAGWPYLRIGNAASCDPRYREHLLETALEGSGTLEQTTDRIKRTPIIVSTTSMLMSRPFILQLKHFTLAIVDEASQILEPTIIGLLSSPCIDRFILIGDYKQLPAVVQQRSEESLISDPLLRAAGITDARQSLFERLYRWELAQGRRQFIGILNHQGRMHPDVASFPAERFYLHEGLTVVPLPHQNEQHLDYALPSQDAVDDILKTRRVAFFNAVDSDDSTQRSNTAEARIVADLLRRIYRFYGQDFNPEKTVGVIVPYRNQITTIRQATEPFGIDALQQVSIDTVERYQGSQRDVIIYSFTISHQFQLDFLTANTFEEDGRPIDRKLNVALTRARKQMLMVGNARVLSTNPLFRELINISLIEESPLLPKVALP